MKTIACVCRLAKRSRLWIVSALSVLVAGCDVHEFPAEEPPVPPEILVPAKCVVDLRFVTGDMPLYTTVIYDPNSPEGIKPRSGGNHACDFRYSMEIYGVDEDGKRKMADSRKNHHMVFTTSDLDNLDRQVEVDLPPGRYHLLAWGDYVSYGSEEDLFYDTSDFKAISVVGYEEGRHPGNNETRDAFRGETFMVVPEPAVAGPSGSPAINVRAEVEMKRPLARFRFVTTDLGEFISRMNGGVAPLTSGKTHPEGVVPDVGDYRVVVRYTGYMPSVYNAYADKPIDSALGKWFEGNVRQIDESSAELAFDHVFVNGSETTVQVALEVYSLRDNSKIASTRPIDVPVVRGKLTEIRGPFLTTKAAGGVGISPGFDGDFNIEIK